jgi:hypothetical protein
MYVVFVYGMLVPDIDDNVNRIVDMLTGSALALRQIICFGLRGNL